MSSIEHQKKMHRSELIATSNGHRVAYTWSSEIYNDAVVSIVFAWPGEKVNAEDHGMPMHFAASLAIKQSGPMSAEWATEKLQAFDEALGIVDRHEL